VYENYGVKSPLITNLHIHRSYAMAEKLDPKELVSFKELLMANSMQVVAVAQLLIEKGIITKEEFIAKLKQVQMEYKKDDH
jgi:hypothetical protein